MAIGINAGLNLQGIDFSNVQSDPGAAAGGGKKVAQAFESVRKGSVDYGEMAKTGLGVRAQKFAEARLADARVESNRLEQEALTKAAEMQAEADKAAAQSAAQSSMIGKGIGAVASIGAALIGSDENIKHDIKQIDDALAILRNLRPVSFHYNEEYSSSPERLHHGFIAQEYRKVLPDATYTDESSGKLCIDTTDVIGILVRAVQQLEERVAYLEVTKALAGVK